jgi:hypothetical protein
MVRAGKALQRALPGEDATSLVYELVREMRLAMDRKNDAQRNAASAEEYPYPSHWSVANEYSFEHLVRDGWRTEDAAAHIESEIQDGIDAAALPESERPLFLARRALHRMKPLKK